MNISNNDFGFAFGAIHIVASSPGRVGWTPIMARMRHNLNIHNPTFEIIFIAAPPLFTVRALTVKSQCFYI